MIWADKLRVCNRTKREGFTRLWLNGVKYGGPCVWASTQDSARLADFHFISWIMPQLCLALRHSTLDARPATMQPASSVLTNLFRVSWFAQNRIHTPHLSPGGEWAVPDLFLRLRLCWSVHEKIGRVLAFGSSYQSKPKAVGVSEFPHNGWKATQLDSIVLASHR